MGSMLIWALTLPGQEVALYDFLLKGIVRSSPLAFPSEDSLDGSVLSLGDLAAEAYPDAETPCGVSPSPRLLLVQLLEIHLRFFLDFTAPEENIPFERVALLLQTQLLSPLSPNAP